MAIKHIYLVRHGQTADNRSMIHQSINVPLNDRGIQQAKDAGIKLAKLPIDTLLTSDAKRTKETAEIIASAVNTTVNTEPLLRELHRGVLIEGEHHFSLKSIKGALLMFFRAGNKSWHFGDGENTIEFHTRLKKILEMITKTSGEHVVVVTHRGVINGLCFEINHGFGGSLYRFLIEATLRKTLNGSITELTYDSERATKWRVEHK